MRSILILSLFSYFFAAYEAKVYSKCELARILKANGLDDYRGYSLPNWMCLIKHESNFNTKALNKNNSNGSSDYGLFQLNSRWWCKEPNYRSSNGCNTACTNFLDDSIDDDIKCAKRVVRDPNGISAWVDWVKHCKGKNLSSYVSGCNL